MILLCLSLMFCLFLSCYNYTLFILYSWVYFLIFTHCSTAVAYRSPWSSVLPPPVSLGGLLYLLQSPISHKRCVGLRTFPVSCDSTRSPSSRVSPQLPASFPFLLPASSQRTFPTPPNITPHLPTHKPPYSTLFVYLQLLCSSTYNSWLCIFNSSSYSINVMFYKHK